VEEEIRTLLSEKLKFLINSLEEETKKHCARRGGTSRRKRYPRYLP
jgi:hypothetical protein